MWSVKINICQYSIPNTAHIWPYVVLFICYRSEKDASTWSKDKLKKLLIGLKFDGTEGMGCALWSHTLFMGYDMLACSRSVCG